MELFKPLKLILQGRILLMFSKMVGSPDDVFDQFFLSFFEIEEFIFDNIKEIFK